MAVDNQKLFSQMADLGRNINLLSDSVKKNTAAVESMSAEQDNESDKKISDTLNSLDKTLKDIQKSLASSKSKEISQPTAEQKSTVNQQEPKQKEKSDFSKIAGGIAKSVIRAFQEGGVAPKQGNYLVGENGPEIVALPKGSGVIPLDIKDLMAGIAKVPELSEFLKENSKVGVSGGNSDVIVTEDGKRIDLSRLDKAYQDKYDALIDEPNGDQKLLESLGEKIHSIWDLQEKSQKVVDQSVTGLYSERSKLFNQITDQNYTDEDNQYLNSVWSSILEKTDKSDVNRYTIAKAHLMATQMLLEKKSKETSIKDEFDKLGKIEDKTGEVVNPKVAEIKKEAEKSKSEEKSGGLLSKMGLKKREKPEENKEEEGSEKKASAILGKAGKFAENVAFGVASKVIGTNLPGVGGALAQKGLGSLKKLADKELSSKEGSKPSEIKESKSSLSKSEAPTKEGLTNPTLKNDVKKLSPQVKPAETKKDQSEQVKENKPAQQSPPSKESVEKSTNTPKPMDKSNSESSGGSPLGTSKDLDDIKGALSRIASILEGTLTVSPLDSPFRPDSRRL